MTGPADHEGLSDPAAFVRGLAATKDLTRGLRCLGRALESGPPPVCARIRACPSLLTALNHVFPSLNADGREALIFLLGLLLQVNAYAPVSPASPPVSIPASGEMIGGVLQKHINTCWQPPTRSPAAAELLFLLSSAW